MKRLAACIAILTLVLVASGCSAFVAGVKEGLESTDAPQKTVSATTESTAEPTIEPTVEPVVEPTEEQRESKQEGSGTLGFYDVSILGAEKAKTYNKKPAVIIEYEWTNNSDDKTSFMIAFDCKVYQNGVECQTAILYDDDVDLNKVMAEIKPGATMKLMNAYELNDETTPVDVEITELTFFAEPDELVFKQFALE